MNHSTTARLPAFILSTVMTLGILVGVNALATQSPNAEAWLAQQGQMLVSCPVDSGQG
jgi:hypothetical protein